ncbi:exosome component Rrp6 [Brevipalpus obovatus]|uniref:exosome component Rrp6 n=1 Tax=Brevipalpus obovatus TaxID=246614 RepID=UPI003D9E91B0
MTSDQAMDQPQSSDLSNTLQSAVKDAITSSNFILNDFVINSTYHGYRTMIENEEKALTNLMNQLIQKSGTDGRSFKKRANPEDKYEALCIINDNLIDRINNSLDEAEGLKKKDQELIIATLKSNGDASVSTSVDWENKGTKRKFQDINLLTAKNIHRPQAKFKEKIDNRNQPFVPKLKEKPNSLRPLAIFLEEDEEGGEHFCHPYQDELDVLEPSEHILQKVTSVPPAKVTPGSFTFVSTKADLEKLCTTLRSVKEFAVDLEHHSYRSFQGFTCLMQISTRDQDFIIDALELRADLNILNEVFTDPKIVKVFHGADFDILWLQRDFGIYVVNMFDTGRASKLLNLSHHSLAFLLKHYCGLIVDKKFQLADWRIRPLPSEMLKYAQEDTHYLLYIYDAMKNELLEKDPSKDLLKQTFQHSKEICLKRYEKSLFSSTGFHTLIKKSKTNFNPRQMYALKELYSWRDKVARGEDESLGYILPNHMMMQIADVLPREQQGILACCNPVPPMVKQQLNELHQIITRARNIPLEGRSTYSIGVSHSIVSQKGFDFDSSSNFRSEPMDTGDSGHLPTLLGDGKGDDIDYEEIVKKYESKQSDSTSALMDFFSMPAKRKGEKTSISGEDFLTPYQKFLLPNT